MNKRFGFLVAVFGLAIVTLLILAVLRQPRDWWQTANQQGDELMAKQHYAEAAGVYEAPLRQGVAFYRDGEFEAAATAFSRLDEPESAYNRGNALVMLGKYDEAISSFDRALQFESEWKEASQNRAIAVARRDRMKPPEDDAGGTGGQLEADEIVFDDRAKKSSQTKEVEVGKGEQMSDAELREVWLKRVQTKPADFLRAKFAYQISIREKELGDQAEN